MRFLDRQDGICAGIEVTVVETYGSDGMYLLKEESVLEVALSPGVGRNMLVVVIVESNELEYVSLIKWTDPNHYE